MDWEESRARLLRLPRRISRPDPVREPKLKYSEVITASPIYNKAPAPNRQGPCHCQEAKIKMTSYLIRDKGVELRSASIKRDQ